MQIDKYDLLESIKEKIQQIEGYANSGFMYAHLVGILSVYVSHEDLWKILQDLNKELELKNLNEDLAYEKAVGK